MLFLSSLQARSCGVLCSFSYNGTFENDDEWFTCWNCSEIMLIKQRKTTNPIIRCESCDERPRIRSHSDAAFTPAHGLLSSGNGNRMGDLSVYEFMDRMVWLTGNGQAPGACVDLCRDDGQKIAEDAVYNMHQRIRVCFKEKPFLVA